MREAIGVCARRENLRSTLSIAAVVGTVLLVINQGDVILRGDATGLTWVKVALSYCVPFVVSNLGLLAGTRTERQLEGSAHTEPDPEQADAAAAPPASERATAAALDSGSVQK